MKARYRVLGVAVLVAALAGAAVSIPASAEGICVCGMKRPLRADGLHHLKKPLVVEGGHVMHRPLRTLHIDASSTLHRPL